ncbi:hypothetical protein CC80DRAFT_403021 [Byssothecium circinans]|uniref:PARP catalytic domain-containing protein n=1 Tax=Byssothecium circinans TaxID=147558 RepID=A0A6A5UBZ4_9PLEO|nr:hypothetical protein CC80DRAFT_403021 [Byssothecium circinans]
MKSLCLEDPRGKLKGLTPEQFLDSQIPLWRIWARWTPDDKRLRLFNDLPLEQKAILYDVLALEGPDFASGGKGTLREGLLEQYGSAKHIVSFRSLLFELPRGSTTKDTLAELLNCLLTALENSSRPTSGEQSGPFKLFTELTLKRPITLDALQLVEATSMIEDTPKWHVHNAVLEIFTNRECIAGRHILSLQHVICALEYKSGEALSKVLLMPWLIEGIERCISQCQLAIRTHIEAGAEWSHLIMEFYTFCGTVKSSGKCFARIDGKVRALLEALPSIEVLRTVLEIYAAIGYETMYEEVFSSNRARESIEAWCISRLIEKSPTVKEEQENLVGAMVEIWSHTKTDQDINNEKRKLAILVSRINSPRLDHNRLLNCLHTITILPQETTTCLLSNIDFYNVQSDGQEGNKQSSQEASCIGFLRLLTTGIDDAGLVECWRFVLFVMMEASPPTTMLEYIFDHFRVRQWLQIVRDVYAAFADIVETMALLPLPFLLQERSHRWIQRLSIFLPTLERLENTSVSHPSITTALKFIFKGGEGTWVDYLIGILEDLTKMVDRPVERLMQKVVGQLESEGLNAKVVASCVKALRASTSEGLDACEQIWDGRYGVTSTNTPTNDAEGMPHPSSSESVPKMPFETSPIPTVVLEVMIAGFLQDNHLISTNEVAIKALARLFNLSIHDITIPDWKLDQAALYWAAEGQNILNEAERLHRLKRALRAKDPEGTKILLEKLGIEDISPLDEEIEELDVEVAGAVEKLGENEVEMSFSLAGYTELQRSGLGIGDAKALLVRLFLDYSDDIPTAFCLHLDTDVHDWNSEHTPWVPPLTTSARLVSRILHRNLNHVRPKITRLHAFIKKMIIDLTESCAVCGRIHHANGIRLRRSLPCDMVSCKRTWDMLPLDVRFPELRIDTFAVDLILTTVYAAARCGKMELLPGCPITNAVWVQGILDTLPHLSTLRPVANLARHLASFHRDAERLIVWALTHFRGFLTTATGILKIPSLPTGTHQFILASASPDLEMKYSSSLSSYSKYPNPKTTVLFHGTSLDRLPSILASGLREYSGTSLQRTGAVHGNGIYLAEEPSFSFSYSATAVSWTNSGLNGMRMVLGCEVVGDGNSVAKGVHVLHDPAKVMVRYVFMFPGSAHAPPSQHVVPAMASAMSALRTGAV